ncbi:MAG: ankyrin repeat domain-containing protein [Verrucomicrobia bacterium]|nr:ankyrin repeat domain-containing protein [Verrucomicrobiota bacterium]
MAAKPVSASTPTLLELCQDEISLKPLADAVRLSCGCYYNTETAEALERYHLLCIQHEKFSFYYEVAERITMITRAVLQKETSSSEKELTPANVSTEIPEAAKSLYEKGKILFQKQFFKEAARAFLGATLHCPSYAEAQDSLDSALKFLPDPSSDPQISSLAFSTPCNSAPTTSRPRHTEPEPTPAASQDPPPAPTVNNIDKLNTGTIVHNNNTTYAPQTNYAPVTKVKDGRRVDKKVQNTYAPQTTYAPTHYNNTSYHINYAPVTMVKDGRRVDKKVQNTYALQTSLAPTQDNIFYHISGAPGSGVVPAAAEPPRNKPAAPVLPDYVKNAKTPEGKGKALIKAIDRKEKDMVDYLLEKGAKLDVEDEKHRTPLQTACEGNWPEVVQLLIDNGAKTDGEDARTSLITAAQEQYREVVKILVRSNTLFISQVKSRYNGHPVSGCEAFALAVRNGDSELVSFFIDEMKIDLQDPINYTESRNRGGDLIALQALLMGEYGLDIACEIQNLQLVQLLLDRGAKINKSLLVATEKGNLPILQLLCSKKEALHPSPSKPAFQYFTLTYENHESSYPIIDLTYADLALLKACKSGNLEFARLLITTTNLIKHYEVNVGYNKPVYMRLDQMAYQVSSVQDIKNLFLSSIRAGSYTPLS